MSEYSTLTAGSPQAGKKALLLHGVSSDRVTYKQLVKDLAADGYYAVAVDFKGHGKAGKGDGDYSMEGLAKDVLPLIKELGPLDLLVGHSLGCIVALKLLAIAPVEHELKLLLIDPPLEKSDQFLDGFTGMLLADKESVMKDGEGGRGEGRAGALRDMDEDAVAGILKQNRPWNYFSLLPTPTSSNISTILLRADPTSPFAAFSPEETISLKESHPHVQVAMVQGAGHSCHEDRAEVVATAARDWAVGGEGLVVV